MSTITTHVLDTSRGRPAGGVRAVLERQTAVGEWELVGRSATDSNGRIGQWPAAGTPFTAGLYRLTFDTAAYFRAQNVESIFPEVAVIIAVRDAAEHYHIPLLLSPFGYSTYRGS